MTQIPLTDEEWKRIEVELPQKPGCAGRRAKDNRLFIEAILWIAHTGAPWRDLPPEFGKWFTIYIRFRRWSQRGAWDRVLAAMSSDAVQYVLTAGSIRAVYELDGDARRGRLLPGAFDVHAPPR
jgi:transposase